MATHRLAAILKKNSNDDEDDLVLVKQTRPPKFNDEEYDSYVDCDLWDLPSTPLNPLDGVSQSRIVLEGEESSPSNLNLSKFDLISAIDQVLEQVGLVKRAREIHWEFWKWVEEPEFGPGLSIQTVYIIGKLGLKNGELKDHCKWMCIQKCLHWFLEAKPGTDRMGPLVFDTLLNYSNQPKKWKIPLGLHFQEYPPGVKLIPMRSRTQKPFCTTNLVVFAPESNHDNFCNKNIVAYGDALIVDPGCQSQFHKELMEIIAELPRKLVVFVTHHHPDHVDGLSVVQRSNPEASLLIHERTMCRIRKDDWSLGYTSVSGDEEICIGGQQFKVLFAPGHTDGHMALLHVDTHSLIVGDHCVGQGSAVLDINSGGNMSEYIQTTYRFMELSPHLIIPMHGRVNLWPKHMLCGYLKNRRYRESTILKAIEDGSKTLFDIVEYAYGDVDRHLWIPASSNVRLHVDHLAKQNKLPKEFSLENFRTSCAAFSSKVSNI